MEPKILKLSFVIPDGNTRSHTSILLVLNDLGVNLVTLKSKKYDGMIDLAEKKKRFPSTMARFCTSELKTIPFIDYVLEQEESLLIIQGIRARESYSRKQMQKQCRMFKYYFESYNDKGRKRTYRWKEVRKWCSMYSDDILRPVFSWTGQQVIDYITENKQEPNELYKQGFRRIGCFPCIMSSHGEIYELIKRYPEHFETIIEYEKKIGSSFFNTDAIPYRFRTGICPRTGKKFTTALDIKKYLTLKDNKLKIFDDSEFTSYSNYYHLYE